MTREGVKDEHVKDAAQDVSEGAAEGVAEVVPHDVAQELAYGARAPRAFLASPLATTAAVFVQLTLR